eukprot:g5388.t1
MSQQRAAENLIELQERALYIPVRLNNSERALLSVCNGALDVSEYTDKVDVSRNDYYVSVSGNKSSVVISELDDLCQILVGLKAGCALRERRATEDFLIGKSHKDNEEFFQEVLEIGRRYKIMNPDKMRSTYGKLLFAIMDSVSPYVFRTIGFSIKKKIKNIRDVLETAGAEKMLADPLVLVATHEVLASDDRSEVKEMTARKAEAEKILCERYSNPKLSADDVRLCLASIADNNSFLRSNRDPVERMIFYLKSTFSPETHTPGHSLQIRHGRGGSKLSHDHKTQYYFCLQTLTLWSEIMNQFFKLWTLAEQDLLDDCNGYRLMNTGQGLQRCQSAPRVARAMSQVLATAKARVGRWIGLSVVHLGDRDVPNALVFIDKYTQVRRILAPLASTLDKLPSLMDNEGVGHYVEKTFGDVSKLRKMILADFFKHGFDGSGDDGGSCIDGRLTSCWNWCSKLDKKPYKPVFLLTGFSGFDGDFRE